MFSALGRVTTRHPWLVIASWLIVAIAIIATAPKLTSTQDQAEFLPAKYESIRAATLQADAFPKQDAPGAILVFDRTDGGELSADDTAKVEDVVASLNKDLPDAFTTGAVTPASENKRVQIAVVGLAEGRTGYDVPSMDAAEQLRKDAKPLLAGSDLRLQMTGAAPQSLDSQESSERALAIVGLATIALIVLLLAVIFRSVLICLLPVVVVGVVSQVATGLIGFANEIFDLKADSSVQTILVVVLYGIGTDYILFLLFRYRERLRLGEDKRTAMVNAMHRAGEAIASAGGAVIVAFLALILSSLGIFRAIGPALAIAVGVTLVAALTLVPAVMTLLGRGLFWPSKSWQREPEAARFAAVGRSLGRRPAAYAALSGIVLASLAVLAFGFQPSFDFNSSLPKGVESTEAMATLQKGYPAGATDPTTVVVRSTDGQPLDEAALGTFGTALGEARGVAQVAPPLTAPDGRTAVFSAYLDHDPGAEESMENVKGPIRDAVHAAAPDGAEALVGGTTSVFVDLNEAMIRDYSVVFPVAALVIMVILALLLRSLVAPLYLMLSVGLGFGATLGASVLVFQHIQGESGLIFMLPMYIYLFVVALGTDYNILMIARLRDEARSGRTSRDAAAQALKHAGPTVAAAGVILAGTFASLMLSGNTLMTSMGFALSFGIGVAAFVMAMFFTPSLTALIGHAAWWPGKGDEGREEPADEPLVDPHA